MKNSAHPAHSIHPTAIVDPQAQLGEGVEIGAFAVVGPHVQLGAHTRLLHHTVVDGRTRIGARCTIYPFACIGMPGQDKKFKNEVSYLEIGDDNTIREYVTMHLGSTEGSKTVVGHRNLFMANSHVAHDCRVGSDVVVANSTALGGYVVVEDHAVLSGLCGVHQFVRIGKYAMLGGVTKPTKDILPFSMVDGRPAEFCGLNSVGLKRAGFSSAECVAIKRALKILVDTKYSYDERLRKLETEFPNDAHVAYLLQFAQSSERGFAH